MSASLKGFLPALARHLGSSPSALYERQRALVRADLLKSEGGRGPGSGVRTTAGSVAMLVIAALATDSLAETEDRAHRIAESVAVDGTCPLTGHRTFLDALASILVTEYRAAHVECVAICRSTNRARIVYREGRSVEVSEFRGDEVPPAAIQVSAQLSGNALRQIAEDVIFILEHTP